MRRKLNIAVSLLAAGLLSLLLLPPVTGLFGRAYGIAGEVSVAVLGEADSKDHKPADRLPSARIDLAPATGTDPPLEAASPLPVPTLAEPTLAPATRAAQPLGAAQPLRTPEPTSIITASPTPHIEPTTQHQLDIRTTNTPTAILCPSPEAKLTFKIDLTRTDLSLTNTGETSIEAAILRLTMLRGASAVQAIEISGHVWRPGGSEPSSDFKIEGLKPGAPRNKALDLVFRPADGDPRQVELLIELWTPACDTSDYQLVATGTAVFIAPPLEPAAEPKQSAEAITP